MSCHRTCKHAKWVSSKSLKISSFSKLSYIYIHVQYVDCLMPPSGLKHTKRVSALSVWLYLTLSRPNKLKRLTDECEPLYNYVELNTGHRI